MPQQQKLHRLITRAFSYAMRAGHRWLGLRTLHTGQPAATATGVMFHPPVINVRFRYIETPTIELTLPAVHSRPGLLHRPREGPEFK